MLLNEFNINQSFDLVKMQHEMKMRELLAQRREAQLAEQIRQERQALRRSELSLRLRDWLQNLAARPSAQKEVK